MPNNEQIKSYLDSLSDDFEYDFYFEYAFENLSKSKRLKMLKVGFETLKEVEKISILQDYGEDNCDEIEEWVIKNAV